MSWQAYIDTSLIGSHKVDKAAIFSAAGDSVWAASSDFRVERGEVNELLTGYKDHGYLLMNGFHIGKTKYLTLKCDDRSIYGKQGKEGVVCVKTKQAILIAHYAENTQPGEATTVVEKLADYLISVGY